MKNEYRQISDERYDVIISRYAKFQKAMYNDELEVVRVFDPLKQKQLDELELIREVSKDLQKKKDDEINKAAKAEEESKKENKVVDEPVATENKDA